MRRLVIRPGAIGDFLVSLPAIERLRTGYLEVWTAAQNVPLVRSADRARSIASSGLDLLGVLDPNPRLIATLRGFDSIVSWYGSNRPEFRALVASLGLPFEFLPALPPAAPDLHAVDFYLQQVGHPPGAIPRIPTPTRERRGAVLHPFSGSLKKNWPLDRYRELAGRLEAALAVKWCAGPEDQLSGAVRIDDLYELACWLAGARLFVGNDSGIAHLAAAVGTPVVALFGRTNPRVWAPRGDCVRVVAAPDIASIRTETVLETCLRLVK